MNPLGLKCRGLLHRGGGIHSVPSPTGQREAGSLRRVAADQAADPRPLAGDGLELRLRQPPALSHRKKQPRQGEGTSARVVSLPSVGQGAGGAANILVSWGVTSGFCHQKKHALFCNGNVEAVLLVFDTLLLPWLWLGWGGKEKVKGSGGAGP